MGALPLDSGREFFSLAGTRKESCTAAREADASITLSASSADDEVAPRTPLSDVNLLHAIGLIQSDTPWRLNFFMKIH